MSTEQEKMNICEECLKYYNSGAAGGLNCAESTLKGIADYLGLESDAIYKIATPFGGGIGRTGNICGSLVGGLMALGLVLGRTDSGQERKPAYDSATVLLNKFSEKYGTVNCSKITGLNLKDEEQVKERKEYVHENICRPLVARVCTWVKEIVEESSGKETD